jgi:hypothetical protein
MLRATKSRGVDARQFRGHAATAGLCLAGPERFFLILAAMAGMESYSKMFGVR